MEHTSALAGETFLNSEPVLMLCIVSNLPSYTKTVLLVDEVYISKLFTRNVNFIVKSCMDGEKKAS